MCKMIIKEACRDKRNGVIYHNMFILPSNADKPSPLCAGEVFAYGGY